jgi:hypothetical protein
MTQYIIIDTKTGAWDGLYLTREGALEAFESLSHRVPQASWVFQEYTGKKPPFAKDFWLDIYSYEDTK